MKKISEQEMNQLPLHKLLVTKLRVLLDVENQILKALPKIVSATTNKSIKQAFKDHLVETRGHVRRLNEAFKALNLRPQTMQSAAIRGLAEDASWVIKNVPKGAPLDSNLIAAASYVEHYEMAGYTAAELWAKEMGHTEVARLLRQTLKEEQGADTMLRKLSPKVNKEAMKVED